MYLYTEISSVHVVAEKEVFGGGGRPADLEELHEVVELPVDVAADRDRRLDLDHALLRAEQVGALVDDLERGRLVDAALEDEVLLQHVGPRLVRPRVEHVRHHQLLRGREGDACKQERKGIIISHCTHCAWLDGLINGLPFDPLSILGPRDRYLPSGRLKCIMYKGSCLTNSIGGVCTNGDEDIKDLRVIHSC